MRCRSTKLLNILIHCINSSGQTYHRIEHTEEMANRMQHDSSSDSDSNSSFIDTECEICGVTFSSIQSYESHVKGKKHLKKVAKEKFLLKHLKASDKKVTDDDSIIDDDNSKEIRCEVCNKYFTDHVSFIAHLVGSVHAKHLKKQKLKKRMKDMPEVLDSANNEENGTDDDDATLQKPFAQCAICQKTFSGPEPFDLHIKSSSHKKKVQKSKLLDNLKIKYKDEAKKSDDEDIYDKCDVCQKSFSGPIPYFIHMESSVHNKNLERMKIAEEMKEFYSKDDSQSGYACKECKKTFSDPLSFKNHLANNNHEKKKAKDALLGFLSEFPEISFVTPFDKQTCGADSDDSEQEYYLICKICHVSFSGPESAQNHVKSKKHVSLKKEKRLSKLIREQKKGEEGQISNTGSSEAINQAEFKKGQSKANGVSESNNYPSDDFELI